MYLLSPTGPLGLAVLLLRGRVDRARAAGRAGDRGASAIEWVVITAMLVLIAGAVFTILLNKIKTTANGINTTPAAPGGP
jgi:hypothetical protein